MMLNYFGIIWPVSHPKGSCRVCGCTEDRACPGGCWWKMPEVCSRCCERAEALLIPPRRKIVDFWRALEKETDPNVLAFALHNATGDWRRGALYTRLAEVREK